MTSLFIFVVVQGITLLELNRYVRRVLALNFAEPLWVKAELGQVSVSRGHYYLDLIEQSQGKDQPVAQARANLWSSQLQMLRRNRGAVVTELLKPGLELLLKVEPVLHERFGYSLKVLDIDPAFTEGLLSKAKRETIARLQAENLLERNARQPIPIVAQRIAVISSEQAAGYADFCRQLLENEWSYDFKIRLFRALVQGENAPEEIAKRLREIARRKEEYDLVCILRGGGSKLDLLAFDQEALCRQVAHFPLPVLAAIGHETDQSVLDLVAHTSVKTPTAAAVFLTERVLQFEQYLLGQSTRLAQGLTRHLQTEGLVIDRFERSLSLVTASKISTANNQLQMIDQKISSAARQTLSKQELELVRTESVLNVLDPQAILARGYALISQNGQLLSRAEQSKSGTDVQIDWVDGRRQARLFRSGPDESV
ncbi:MAG: exodeoxyribonuclease VII large subunit [Bacteroidota bacterium]